MFRPRRIWRRCRTVILTAGGLIVLVCLAFYIVTSLLPSAREQIGVQKSVDRLQSWNKASRNRLRALCNAQPVVRWSASRQLWIPPVCANVLIYAGGEPAKLAGVKNETELRSMVKENLGSDAFHIYVPTQADFATLGQITGSDFPEKHWPAIIMLEQQTGNKFVWPGAEGQAGAKVAAGAHEAHPGHPQGATQGAPPFGDFLLATSHGEWDQYLKQEALEDLPLDGGTSSEFAPMDINSDFFENYIANTTARSTILREKELFVVFHAPWCGHCRVFLSKFEPLARQILKVNNAAIGFYKLDVTANDVKNPKFRFSQVPTTLFFTRDRPPVELEERRDLKNGIIKFLKKHSHTLNQKDYNEL